MDKPRNQAPDMSQVHELVADVVAKFERLDRPPQGAMVVFIVDDVAFIRPANGKPGKVFVLALLSVRDINEGLTSVRWNCIVLRCLQYILRKEIPCKPCRQSQLTNKPAS